MKTTPSDLSSLYSDKHIRCVIISFGEHYHDEPPGNALVVDTRSLRSPLKDPSIADQAKKLNGHNARIQQYVLGEQRARDMASGHAEQVCVLLNQSRRKKKLPRIDVHVKSDKGHHRSVVIAEEIATYLKASGVGCEVEHRHIGRPLT